MWRSVVRNAAASVGGTLVGLVIGFVTMPLVVHHLGPVQFGLWVLASGIVGYVGMLDLGLAPTLVRETAALLAQDDVAARCRVSETASTVYALYAALGAAAGLVLVAVGSGAGALFRVPADDLATFRLVLLVVGLQTALGLPMSIWQGLLSGLQDFHVLNAIGVGTTIARAALTVGLVLGGVGLVPLVLSSFAVSLAGWAVSSWWARRRIPGLRVRLGGFRRARLHEIGRFSGAMVVWTIAGAALHQLDRILVGVVLPVASLTTYEVGARLANTSRSVLHSWLAIVMPATSALAVRGERGRVRALFLRGTRHLLLSYAGVAVLLLGLGGPFVRLWMGDGYATSTVVMAFLVAGSLVQSQNVVAHVMLPAMGELAVFTRFMAVYAVVSAACATTGILTGGLVGLAAGLATAMAVMEAGFLLLVVRRCFGLRLRRVLARCHVPALWTIAPVALWLAAVRMLVPIASWPSLAAIGAVAGVVFLASMWVNGFTAGERRVIRRRVRALRTPPPVAAGVAGAASC